MAKIYHANLYGLEQEKSKLLSNDDISKTNWSLITPQKPFYLLIPQNNDLLSEYNQGYKITEIMPVNSVGIVTGQDEKTIAFTQEKAEVLADIHRLSEDTVAPILYRPFDQRFIVYDSKVVTRLRGEVMRHLLKRENMAIVVGRSSAVTGNEEWNIIGISKQIVDLNFYRRGGGQVHPLYLYPNINQSDQSLLKEQRRPNLSQNFLNDITSKLGYTPTPEAIFYYIYAIFHSPTYRTRYAEFLKIDFPRVPLTSSDELFRQLAAYGEELVALHLMKSPKLDNTITQYEDRTGNRVVDAGHPKYQQGDVIINKKGDRFTRVPENVWNFYVGGYQVCQKWLKDRKGRTLSNEDILHYQRIVVALQQTTELMATIDAAIPSFPIE